MASDQEKFERQERAIRLKQAREAAGFSGPKGVYDASKGEIDINNYKGHESGRNGFSVSDGRRYADLFHVPLTWLYLGIGNITDSDLPGASDDLKRAFAKLIDAPEAVQQQIISLTNFLTYPSGTRALRPQDRPDDQYESANRRREREPIK